MPVSGKKEHKKIISTFSLGDMAAQFISDINKSLPIISKELFKPRNPVYKKSRSIVTIANHKLQPLLIKDPTFCSQCRELIYYMGESCEQCRLVSHRKCLNSIQALCVDDRDNDGDNVESKRTHQFKSKYFKTLTYCHHCGTLLKGIFSHQGVECGACNLTVHFDCQQKVCFDCEASVDTCSSQLVEPTVQHESRMKIDDFELLRLIGAGSFSKVYLAKLKTQSEDERNSRLFAIKAIKKTNIAISGDSERVFTEMRALGFGRNYQFLTIAHCCFQSNDRIYLVMEYVAGRNLYYHMRKSRKFTEDRAKFYAAEIVLALIYLHENMIIYRDLKSDNIILDVSGHCKLLDFGMSKELRGQSRTRTFCGTPSYIAPEIIREQDYDYSVDWWSLGVLMYEMLVGSSPYDAQSEQALYNMIDKDPVHYPRTLSVRARSILEGLLEKNPQLRLGCQILDDGSLGIKQHPFFLFKFDNSSETHRWEDIKLKRIPPPYIPKGSDLDSNYVDEDYENGIHPKLSPVDTVTLHKLSQEEFDGFSFYSDSFKSLAGLDA